MYKNVLSLRKGKVSYVSKDIEIEIPDRFDEEFVSAAKKLEELVKGDIASIVPAISLVAESAGSFSLADVAASVIGQAVRESRRSLNSFDSMTTAIIQSVASAGITELVSTASGTIEGFSDYVTDVAADILEALEEKNCFLPSDKPYTSLIQKLRGKKRHSLSRGDWLAFANLFVAILLGIWSMQPSKEDLEIIRQNNIIIEQQSIQNELLREENELLGEANELQRERNELLHKVNELQRKENELQRLQNICLIELSHAAQHLEDVGNDADIFNDAADITR